MEKLQHDRIRRREEEEHDNQPKSLNSVKEPNLPVINPGDSSKPQALSLNIPRQIQRKGKPGRLESPEEKVETVQRKLQGGGQSLGSDTKGKMENALGTDLSGVKVHTGSAGNEVASNNNAKALTVGQDIAFGSGEYQPGTMHGDALLAHELAHTVQQKDAVTTQKKEKSTNGNEGAYEKEADDVAVGATTSIWGKTKEWASELGGKTKSALKSGLQLQKCGNNQSGKADSAAKDSLKTKDSTNKGQNKMPQNYNVPPFMDISKNNYTSVAAVQAFLNRINFPIGTDYKSISQYSDLRWYLMETAEFSQLAYGNFHLSYEEAVYACSMKLFDLMKGNQIKTIDQYALLSVKEPSYEEDLYAKFSKSTDPEQNTDTIIQKNGDIWNEVKNIDSNLNVTNDKLAGVVEQKGKILWEKTKGKDSDKPVYWARVKIKQALRKHVNDPKTLKELFMTLDENSRGMNDVKFDKADNSKGAIKKIIVTGFDPFQGGTTNPSGIVAQKMDGLILKDKGKDIAEVQSMTFPNSYTDFDNRFVENHLQKYVSGESAVYMIMTISLDGSAQELYLERFAANTRGGSGDNENIGRFLYQQPLDQSQPYTTVDLSNVMQNMINQISSYKTTMSSIQTPPLPQSPYTITSVNNFIALYNDWRDHYPKKPLTGQSPFPFTNTAPEFIETNFPITEMMQSAKPPANMAVRQRYSYFTTPNPYVLSPNTVNQPDSIRPNSNAGSLFNPAPPATGIKSIEGPGGDYFSNEIYYRVSWMRKSSETTMRNVHLHIPNVGNKMAGKDKKFNINDIFSSARDILTLGVKTQMDIDAKKVK